MYIVIPRTASDNRTYVSKSKLTCVKVAKKITNTTKDSFCALPIEQGVISPKLEWKNLESLVR